jgi:hypothetical protein
MTPAEARALAAIDPRFDPATQLVRRTGAKQVQLLHSEVPLPVVWMAVATYRDEQERFECASAPDPLEAVFRLCGHLLEHGRCRHCGRATIFFSDPAPSHNTVQATIEGGRCPYFFDAEGQAFRRGCDPTPVNASSGPIPEASSQRYESNSMPSNSTPSNATAHV